FFLLVPSLGRHFFPKVDAGQFKLHIRARAGTRIEETANLADRIESFIRLQIPPDQIASIIDNIGLPYSSINLSYSNSAPTGPADADILVTLSPKHRTELADIPQRKFPNLAQLLAGPEEWRELFDRHADPAIPPRFSTRAGEHPGYGSQRRAAGNSGQPGIHPSRLGNVAGFALRYPASTRYLRICRPP